MGPFRVRLYRNKQAYAALDTLDVRVVVYSKSPETVKLKTVGASVRQTVTYLPFAKGDTAADGTPSTAQQRSEILVHKNRNVRKKIHKDEFLMYDLSMTIPKSRTLMSVHTAKHIEISHQLRVGVEVGKERIVFEHLKLQISAFPSSVSTATMARIGKVPSLCLEEGAEQAEPAQQQQQVYAENEPLEYPQPGRFDQYERMLSDETSSIPALENDAAFLGTATPRGPLVFQSDPNSPSQNSFDVDARRPVSAANHTALMQMPSNALRPGDVLPFQGSSPLDSPRRATQAYPSSPLATRHNYGAESPTFAEPVRQSRAPTTAQLIAEDYNRRYSQMPPAASSAAQPVASSTAEPSTHPAAQKGFMSAESEKVRLFERARAEAQDFQSGYQNGVEFPEQRGAAEESVPPAAAPITAAATAPAAASGASSAPRASFNYPSAADEKAALYERARNEVADFHKDDPNIVLQEEAPAPSLIAQSVPSAKAAAPIAMPSAEDEKQQMRRYYEAQDAVAQHHAEPAPTIAPPVATTPPAEATSPPATSPYLTKSEARAVEEKAKLNNHYAQQESGSSAASASSTQQFGLKMLANAASATTDSSLSQRLSTAPPPRPPKLPLS